MPVAAVDFESNYSKEISITTMGVWHYLRATEIYMVSIVTSEGLRWVGPPQDAPWDQIKDAVWVSHNRFFDRSCYERLQELGQAPQWTPKEWHCSADMCAWMGMPRSLAGACQELLGIPVSKDTRDKLKNRKWDTLPPDFQEEVRQYALTDSERCLELWVKFSPEFPQWERDLSLLYSDMARYGVMIDVPLVEQFIGQLKRLVWNADRAIPWSSEHPALSYKKLCEECRKHDIAPPVSLAIDSPDCERWEETYGEQYPWVHAMRTKRRANTLLKKLQTLRSRVRPDGRASLGTKYCGTSTRRNSGEGGINPLNFSREPLLGVELVDFGVVDLNSIESDPKLLERAKQSLGIAMRRCLIAPPGMKIVAPDLSQIEPRVGAVLCGDTDLVEFLTKYDAYEAHARATLNYDRPEKLEDLKYIPEFCRLRQISKIRVLLLGYQGGAARMQEAAAKEGIVVSLTQAEVQVRKFREDNPKIVRTWRKLQRGIEKSVGQDFTITLPSGNTLVYRKIACRDGDYTGLVCKNGRMTRVKIYGGLAYENVCQSVARDVFSVGLLKVAQTQQVLMTVYDEIVCECPLATRKEELTDSMAIPPDWMPSIPLVAKATEGFNYDIK